MSLAALHDVPAPAKLNLFLHVVGRRADGYHLLQSVFVLIDWCDLLHFERRTDGRLSRHDLGPALPPDEAGFCQLGWQVTLARFDEGFVVAQRMDPPLVTVRARLDRP